MSDRTQDLREALSGPSVRGPVEPRHSPYFGLDYYEEKYGAWFFGREAECGTIITNLQAARLTLLHASSGVGKSSLLRAGVARQLLEARSEDAEVDMPVVFSSWRDDPVGELIETIARAIEPFLSDESDLPTFSARLDEAIDAAATAVGSNLVVILDQFEEYFLYCANERPPERFADELARCIRRHGLPASFLISIREDAYAGLGDLFKARIADVYGNYLTIDNLDRDAAKAAICRPLLDVYNKQPGVEPVDIEPALVEAVLDATSGDRHDSRTGAGARKGRIATPLLQLVMESVWERERAQGSRVLRLSTLNELEGIEHIIDTHLEGALAQLTASDRETAVDVFDRLVTESGGKIAQGVAELARRTGHTEQQVGGVLDRLDEERIVRPVPAAPGQDPVRFRRYEIFHDVLGSALNRAVQKQTEARLRRQRNAARRRVALVGALAIVAVAFGVFAFLQRKDALHEKRLALSSNLAVQSGKLLHTDVSLAGLLALAANAVEPTDDAHAALNEVLELPLSAFIPGSSPVDAVAFSPNRGLLAGSDRAGDVFVWSASTHRQLEELNDESTVYSVAFDPQNSELLATGDYAGIVRVWSLHTRKPVDEFHSSGEVHSVAFSPNGGLLAAGEDAGNVLVWNLATRKPLGGHPLHDGTSVLSVAFSGSGNLLASGDQLSDERGGEVVLWNPYTGKHEGKPLDEGASVSGVAFSPHSTMLASGTEEAKVVLWNVERGDEHKENELKDTTSITSVAFSPNGLMVAAGDESGNVRVWRELQATYPPASVFQDASEIGSVAFSPGNETIATGDNAGAVVIWKLASPAQIKPALRSPKPVDSLAFSPHSALLATAEAGGGVRVWNVATREQVLQEPLHLGATSVAFSPNGKLLAAGDRAGEVMLWHAETGEPALSRPLQDGSPVESLAFGSNRLLATSREASGHASAIVLWNLAGGAPTKRSLPDYDGGVDSIAFKPGSELLAAGDYAGTIRLWNAESGDQAGAPLHDGSSVTSVAFSPNGQILASGDDARQVVLWRLSNHEQASRPLTEEGRVSSVAFSPRGDLLASGNEQGEIVLSDAASGARVGAIPLLEESAVSRVAFSPNGRLLASSDELGDVLLLSPQYGTGELAHLSRTLCGEVRTNLTHAQWSQYVPGESYQTLCPGYP